MKSLSKRHSIPTPDWDRLLRDHVRKSEYSEPRLLSGAPPERSNVPMPSVKVVPSISRGGFVIVTGGCHRFSPAGPAVA
jgi:hypothetical protein